MRFIHTTPKHVLDDNRKIMKDCCIILLEKKQQQLAILPLLLRKVGSYKLYS